VPQLFKAIISELLKSVSYHGRIGFLCMSWVAVSKVNTRQALPMEKKKKRKKREEN
jgi:hypothetical protein